VTDIEKWNTALMIAIDNLEMPHSDTRLKASTSDVTVEFYEVRQQLIEYAHTLMQFAE
jgi:hypothetical protein